VNSGSSYTFTITPSAGYYINTIQGCNGTAFTGNSTNTAARTYTTGANTSACTVTASFTALPTYTITTSASGGTISPSGPITGVISGTTRVFTITPNSGSYITSVSGCGGTLSGNTYTTGPITANCTISAIFSTPAIIITATAGSGGTISPSGTITGVTYGSTYTFTVTPDTRYYISSISGCGGTTFTGNSTNTTARAFTTGAITSACTVSATFSMISYTVSTSAGAGGTISPSSTQVDLDRYYTFVVTPNAGYYIASISGCGGTTVTGNSTYTAAYYYTTGGIASACTVSATFSPVVQTYTVTASGSAGGTVSPSSVQVNPGNYVTFNITPSAGYYTSSITNYCGSGTPLMLNSSNTLPSNYTTNAVTRNCSVSVTFAKL